VISNDSKFSDQFMNKASRLTAVDFINHDLINLVLKEVEDDYDICLIDCSPGRFLLHDNIFKAADLLLIPNIPAPLSVYCNNILINELQAKMGTQNKVLSFYNMVQVNKNMHKFYLGSNAEKNEYLLKNYIPFYTEIENISLNKESIFHQLKEFKTNIYYEKLWQEICSRMQWQGLCNTRALVVGINEEQETNSNSSVINIDTPDQQAKIING
jgi:cellulose biosynthesis protein BcsQ